jgi:hypothetical protein
MKRDTLEPFGKNHRTIASCHAQVLKAAGYTLGCEDTQKWSQNLRFLAYGGDNSEDEDEGTPFSECTKCCELRTFRFRALLQNWGSPEIPNLEIALTTSRFRTDGLRTGLKS